ncbi:MAG: hypothetical protein ACI8W3_002846 [Myxococcota bacterium]|jgi:hypothetical protein
MNREALYLGLVAIAFGLGSQHLQGELDTFAKLQLGVGILALCYAGVTAFRAAGRASRSVQLDSLYRPVIVALLVVVAAVGAERLAVRSQVRFDLTFEGQFHIAPATREALASLEGPIAMTVYHDPGDPRIRRTRLLLDEIARGRDISIATRTIEASPEAEDRFAIGSSNTVVIEHGDTWKRVDRPTEGALFEAFASLGRPRETVVYITTGTGEGNIDDGKDSGYSGFAVGLQTEGFDVRSLPSAVMGAIPEDANLVVVLGPQRKMRDGALAALGRYIDRGGSVLAFIEPGVETGLETWLAGYGLHSPNALVIDPTSDPVDGDIAGVSPIVFNYAPHPITEGLERNRNTVFKRARSFELHKAHPRDRLKAVIYTSPYAWLHEGALPLGVRDTPTMPGGQEGNYRHIGVAAQFGRDRNDDRNEGRIVAFGDRDFVSNRYLRALYNLDLAMNAAHWAVARTDRITLRPKSAGLVQFPVPLANSMKAFYGVGLLIPEILLVLGGITWMRQRQA